MNAQFRVVSYCASSLLLALTLSGAAFAQDKSMAGMSMGSAGGGLTQKVIAEDGKVIVRDNTAPPGASWAPAALGSFTVVYYASGGKIEYTYADGTKQVMTRPVGGGRIVTSAEKRPATIKNVGKAAVHFVTVSVK